MEAYSKAYITPSPVFFHWSSRQWLLNCNISLFKYNTTSGLADVGVVVVVVGEVHLDNPLKMPQSLSHHDPTA